MDKRGKRHLTVFVILLGISFLSLLLAVYLSFQSYDRYRQYRLPRQRQTDVLLIQSWMTIPHIARVYGVPETVLFEELGEIPPERKLSLHDIAKKKGITDEQLLEEIRDSIITYQKINPLPSQITAPSS